MAQKSTIGENYHYNKYKTEMIRLDGETCGEEGRDTIFELKIELDYYKEANHKLEQDKKHYQKKITQLQDELAYILYEYLPQHMDRFNAITALNKHIDDDTISSIVTKYKINHMIGEGAAALVYDASITRELILPDISSDIGIGEMGSSVVATTNPTTAIAVKCIRKTKQLKLHYLKRYCDELNALQRLSESPYVINLIENLQSFNHLFIITERFGQNLKKWYLDNHTSGCMVTDLEQQQIIKQVCFAMNDCHRQNIVHRDIKPENILIEERQGNIQIKLCDFGLCELNNQVDKICGTLGFIAPEIILTERSDNGKMTDVWSLGCVILFLLKGNEWFNLNWLPLYDLNGMASNDSIYYKRFEQTFATALQTYIRPLQNELLQNCLQLNSMERPTIQTILGQYFHVEIDNSNSTDSIHTMLQQLDMPKRQQQEHVIASPPPRRRGVLRKLSSANAKSPTFSPSMFDTLNDIRKGNI